MANGSVVVNNGRNLTLKRLFRDSETHVSKFSIGTGTTTPTVTDTDLENPAPLTVTTVDNCDATTGWSASADGTAPATSSTRKEGTFSIAMGKSGTASDTVDYDKTITGTDMSGRELTLFFYVKDSTALAKLKTEANDGVRVVLGTGGFVNINYYDIGGSDTLSVGWNFIEIDVDNPDSTGGSGATETNIDRIRLEFQTLNTSDTLSSGDLLMDFWHFGTAFTADYDTNFPDFDEANRTVAVQHTIPSTDLQGYDLTESGNKNTDGTPLLLDHQVFTVVNKTSDVELVVNNKFRVD